MVRDGCKGHCESGGQDPGDPHGRTAAGEAFRLRSFDGGRRPRSPDRLLLDCGYLRRPELPADSQVYLQFLTLIADFKNLAPVVEEAVSILKAKPAAKPSLRPNRPGSVGGPDPPPKRPARSRNPGTPHPRILDMQTP